MDPLTHGLLGGVCGQALYGRALGRKAVVWGAIGSMLPDIDIVFTRGSPVNEFLWHRSFTHALWLGPVVGPLMGYVQWRRSGRVDGRLMAWIGLFVITLLAHPLLDVFTTWGTQLLHPFSDRRFSLDAIAIVDPVYSLLLLLGLVVGGAAGWGTRAGRIAAATAFALSTAYLFYGLRLNTELLATTRAALVAEGVPDAQVDAHPTLLQLYLRRVVVRSPGEIRIGWVSLWTGRAEWKSFHPEEHALIDAARRTREGRILEWFASGETVGSVRKDGEGTVVEMDDLRYGFPPHPEQGLWGLRFRFDASGRLLPPVVRYNRRLSAPVGELLAEIWQLGFR